MSYLRVGSYNIRGLNAPKKQSQFLEYLRSFPAEIIFLQETFLLNKQALRLRRNWIGQIYSTNYSTFKCGVIILIKKGFPYRVKESIIDKEGRFIVLHGLWGTRELSLINYYAPNFGAIPFMASLAAMVAITSADIIWAGDFNLPLVLSQDRKSVVKYHRIQEQRFFGEIISQLNLLDAWRYHNPNKNEFSFVSNKYKMSSRIDYIFVSASFRNMIQDCSMGPHVFSDHASVTLTIKAFLSSSRQFKWRIPAGFLLIQRNLDDLIVQTQLFFQTNLAGDTSSANRWEAYKVTIRGWIQSQSAQNYKNESLKVRQMSAAIRSKELEMADVMLAGRTEVPLLQELAILKADIKQVLQSSLNKSKYHANRLNFIEGEQSPKLLAWRLRKEAAQNVIVSIMSENDMLVSETSQINGVFFSFYKQLYQSRIKPSFGELAQFIGNTVLPVLTEEESSTLEGSLLSSEIEQAIKDMPKYKAPGPDGLTSELYQACIEEIVEPLANMYQEAYELNILPNSLHQADIIFILKKDKDPTLCTSYRPIALINIDAKILAKILAKRLEPYLAKLIHLNQAGFIGDRGVNDNLLLVFQTLYGRGDSKQDEALCLFDVAKAFDSLEWDFLWAALRAYGIGESFIKWVKLLYLASQSRVSTNGLYSPFFLLERGSRQGCPLSPLLFILAIEVLASNLRSLMAFQGIHLSRSYQKVLLFADDLLIFISKPEVSFPAILGCLQSFSSYSGLMINQDKTELFPLIESAYPWSNWIPSTNIKDKFIYLGIIFTRNPVDLISLNILPIVIKMEQQLVVWNKLPLTLMGRVKIIKIMVLSAFMYCFINIPLIPDQKICSRLDRAIHKFIWAGRPARIGRETLQLSKYMGGLALANFKRYWMAAQCDWLRRLLKSNPLLDKHSGRELLYWIYSSGKLVSYLASYVGQLGKLVFGINSLSRRLPSLWTPVTMFPFLSEDWIVWAGINWSASSFITIESIVSNRKLIALNDLQAIYEFPVSNEAIFRYSQLRSVIVSFFRRGGTLMDPGIIERFLFSEEGLSNSHSVVALTYNKMNPSTTIAMQRIWNSWAQDLGEEITLEEQERLWWETIPDLFSIYQKLILFKTVHRTYLTPKKLHSWDPSRSEMCPKCRVTPGDLVHLLWRCPRLHRFWEEIFHILSQILEMDLSGTLKMAVLQILPHELNFPQHLRRFLHVALVSGKKCLLMNWIAVKAPQTSDWIYEMIKIGSYVFPVNSPISDDKTKRKYQLIWQKFREIITTRNCLD